MIIDDSDFNKVVDLVYPALSSIQAVKVNVSITISHSRDNLLASNSGKRQNLEWTSHSAYFLQTKLTGSTGDSDPASSKIRWSL